MQVEALTRATGEVRANFAAVAAEMPEFERKPGSNTLPPRLIERRAKTPGKGPILYIRDGKKEISTRLPPSRRADAEVLLELYKYKEEAKERGIVGSRHKPVAEVLDEYLASIKPTRSSPQAQHDRYVDAKSRVATLKTFFGDATLKDVKRAKCLDFVEWRVEQPDGRYRLGNPLAPKVTEATAREDLQVLKRAVGLCVDENRLNWTPNVYVPPNCQPRTRWLRRIEVARMLWAIRGRVWDRETNDWKVETVIGDDGREVTRRFLHPPEVIAQRRLMARYVFLGLYSGTRDEALRQLQWVVSDEGGCIDVESGIIHRRGFGKDPNLGKPRHSSKMSVKLAAKARPWRQNDLANRISHVFHQPNGEAYLTAPYWNWRAIKADAAIGKEVTPHTLRHSAATWMRALQCDVRLCADVLGMSIEAAVKIYGQWTMEGQQEAADVLAWGKGLKAMTLFSLEDAIKHAQARAKHGTELSGPPPASEPTTGPEQASRERRLVLARHGRPGIRNGAGRVGPARRRA